MNPFTEVRANQLIQRCGVFQGYTTKYTHTESDLVDSELFGRVNTIFDRVGEEIQLFPAQRRVLQRLLNPLSIKTAQVELVSSSSVLDNVHGKIEYHQNFPTNKILNLPPGYGKTILSVLTTFLTLGSDDVREKMRMDFEMFLIEREIVQTRSVRHFQSWSDKTFLLDNAALIQAPIQLVGAWQNTFSNNQTLFERILGKKIHIVPQSSETLRMKSFDPTFIRSHPDELFIFIVHHDNMKDYLTRDDEFFSYGIFISDECADSKSAPLMPQNNLAGMYGLLVTATPAGLADRISSIHSTEGSFLYEAFRHPRLSKAQIAHCITAPHTPWPAAWLRSESIRSFMGAMVCEVLSMNIVPDDLYQEITEEVTQMIPPMHEYVVNCEDSYARRMGIVAHDMAAAGDSNQALERVLNLRLSGKSVTEVIRMVERQLSDISRSLDQNPLNPNELKCRRASLERFKTMIQTEDKTCGICLGEVASERFFTTCCAFMCCRSCIESLAKTQKLRCPKCRFDATKFSAIDMPERRQKKRGRAVFEGTEEAGAGAGAGAGADEEAAKNCAGFEQFVATFDFAHASQMQAVEKLLYSAQEFGLTHIVIAGPYVDSWMQFGPTIRRIAGFEIVRARKNSIRKLDAALHSFCTDAKKQILVLDSNVDACSELTGIDAKLTDLIIQIGDQLNSKQLSGRALRIGRDPLMNPVKIVLS